MLGAVGGLTALVTGASLASVLELVYFLTVRLWEDQDKVTALMSTILLLLVYLSTCLPIYFSTFLQIAISSCLYVYFPLVYIFSSLLLLDLGKRGKPGQVLPLN